LCTATKERLSRLDRLGRLQFVSIREPGAAAEATVPLERLERRMFVKDRHSGRLAEGIEAVAAIARLVPALMPLWPLLTLSARLGVGQRVYDWIAARRTIVPVGQCESGSCPIHR
jgi:predicted DCC family thiol-disulfide oxidoreductase YuxK